MDEVPNNGSHSTSCSTKRSASFPSAVVPEPENLPLRDVLAWKR
jgi:hypothetical protein